MHAVIAFVVGLLAAAAASASVGGDVQVDIFQREAESLPGVVEFDHGEYHYVVLPQIESSRSTRAGGSNHSEGLTARSTLDVLLNRRQSCPAGYNYCQYGYCKKTGNVCCPNGSCDPGEACCGMNHCRPAGSVCCQDEGYCEAGNHCYYYEGYDSQVCCTNSLCTAVVRGGSTMSRTRSSTRTTPPPSTATAIDYSYYTFTYIWTYYYYYWYTIDITRSVVTSTVTTDRTIVSFTASDADAATSRFSAVSATLTPPTPAAATSLASLAGLTTTAGGATGGAASVSPDSSTPARPSALSAPPAVFGNTLSSTSSTTSRTTAGTSARTTVQSTLSTGSTAADAGGFQSVGQSDRVLGWWLFLGATTGVMMVVL